MHVYRERNKVADFLAKMLLDLSIKEVRTWHTPPEALKHTLQQDRMGMRWPREVPPSR